MATFGSFPGVRVETRSGGISAVVVGEEEKLVLFGEANYALDSGSLVVEGDDVTLDVSASSPEQITSTLQASAKFGSDSELSLGMQEALANGANINFLFGVAVPRVAVEAEVQSTQTGTLDNVELVENTGAAVDTSAGTIGDQGIEVTDTSGPSSMNVELRYNGAPNTPTESDTVFVNPLTGEYAADAAPGGDYEFDYTFNDYSSAFSAPEVKTIVNENETGIYAAMSDSDAVSASLATEVLTLRQDFQLVNGLAIAEPNDNELLDDANSSDENGGADARYDAATYSSANQSVSEESIYKFAPGREQNERKTIVGGLGGLFAGNSITNPIYNDELNGFQSLEQQLSKTDADNLRAEDLIPVRSGGAVRVQGNRSTAFSGAETVAADFFTRRITDRVILIGRQVGQNIIGRINDGETRALARRLIIVQLRSLVRDGLLRANSGEEQNFSVEVSEDPTNPDEVDINISFTPFGIVKRVDETITVNTN
jgi:hypothetical protein